MYLKAIGARNLLGYKRLDLEVQPGLWLIEGTNHHFASSSSNGSGKSTLEEAIAFPTFGKTIRPLKLDEVINESSTYASAWNDYVRTDGSEFRIERYRRHPRYGNQARLLLGGEDKTTGRYVSDTDDNIIHRLGFDYELFIRAIIIHSRITESFVSVKDRYLKLITEKLIGMPDFKPLLDRTKEAARSTEVAIDKLQDKIEWTKSNILDLGDSLNNYKDRLKAVEKSLDKTRRHSLAEIKREKRLIREAEQSKAEAESKLQVLEIKYTKLKTKQLRARSAYEHILAEQNKFYQREVLVKQARMELLVKQKDKYRNLFSANCPECDQPVTKGHIKRKINEINKEFGKLNEAVAVAQVEVGQKKRATEEAKKHCDSLIEEESRIKELIYYRKKDIETAEDKIASHAKMLKTRRKQAEQENPYQNLIQETEKKITLAKWKLADLEAAFRKRKKRYLYYEYWKRGFGPQGIRSFILDAVMPVLNHNANIYLDVLTDGQMSVRMAPTREKKDGTLGDQFTFEVDNLSGSSRLAGDSDGELSSVDLAVNLAMSDVLESRISGGFGFLFIDQAIDLLDTARGRKAIQLLRHKLNPKWCEDNGVPSKRTIWLITHREQLKGLIDDRIMVEKRNKVCRITYSG